MKLVIKKMLAKNRKTIATLCLSILQQFCYIDLNSTVINLFIYRISYLKILMLTAWELKYYSIYIIYIYIPTCMQWHGISSRFHSKLEPLYNYIDLAGHKQMFLVLITTNPCLQRIKTLQVTMYFRLLHIIKLTNLPILEQEFILDQQNILIKGV